MKTHFYELSKDSSIEFYSSLKNLCKMNNLVYKTIYSQISTKNFYTTRDSKMIIRKVYFKDMPNASQKFIALFSPFLLKVEHFKNDFVSNETTFFYKEVSYKVKNYESKSLLYANDTLVIESENQQDIIDFIFC